MDKISINITIPIIPRSKKNSQQIVKVKGRPIIIPSKPYKDYERACKPYLLGIVEEPISTPVEVKCTYYMPTKRLCDLTNMLECTDDVLVKYGVLSDDNYKVLVSHDGSRVLYDHDFPRTEISIRSMPCTD